MIDKAGLLFLLGLSMLGVNGCAGGGGESGSPTIPPVGGVNTPPSISGAPPAVAAVGAMFAFKPSATDQDGDTLTFSIENRPGWASFSNATGNLTGLPGRSDVGNYDNIVIAASDGQASSSLDSFSLRVDDDGSTNTVPTIAGTPATSATAGDNYSFVPSAADGDGDALTFSVQNLPAWATFSAQTGALTGTPQNESVGSYPDIAIAVSDGRATASLASFTITVQSNGSANAPVISGTPVAAIPIGSIYTFAPTASDADGDALTFFVEGLPVWAFFNSGTGEITGIPQAANVGSYTDIVISVSDGLASASLPSFSITVIPSGANNRPPSISGTPAASVLVGSNFFFEPVAADPDGDRLSFKITNFPSWASFSPATGAVFGAPQVGDEGDYSNIVISVTDRQSTVSLAPFSITVSSNGAPTITGSPGAQVTVGSNYTFTPNAVDPDGDALIFSIRNLPSWASFNPATGTVTGIPQVGDEGIFSGIVIEVGDGVTTTPMAPFGIAVDANGSPVISGTPASQIEVGDSYQFVPVASDPEGDTVTFSMLGLTPDWLSLDPATGALTGTPQSADVGVHGILVLVANDGYSSTALTPFAITVNPTGAPVISGTPSGQINVGQTYSFAPTASDPNGDALSFSIQNAPAWAAFSASSGTLSGAPQAADIGAYAGIVISVTDGQNSASLAAFTVTVNSSGAPMISGTPATEVDAGQNYAFAPAATDPDGDPLTFSIQNLPAWANFSTTTGSLSGIPQNDDAGSFANIVISVSDGVNSASLPAFSITVIGNTVPAISGTPATSVTIGKNYAFTPTAVDSDGDTLTFSIQNRPLWASFSNASGALTGSPQPGSEGAYSNIVITVSDGQDSASLAPFTITVDANGLPVINGTPAAQVNVDQAYSFTPTATDPDGDALTFTVQNRPAWATFSVATGALSGTPANGQQGTYGNIVIAVSDGQDTASLAPFSITVNGNTAPTIGGTPPTSLTIGDTYSFTPSASDADGDTLSFTIQGRPAWATFSTTTGTVSGTPQSADAGLYGGIVITVSDGEEQTSLTPFGITVVANAAPTISGTPQTQVNVDAGYSFVPTASDPEGDTLTFSVLNKPVWANFSSTTGTLSGTPDPGDEGTYSNIVISVSDGQSSAALPSFTLTVSQVSTGSVSFTWTPPTLNEDGSTLSDLTGYRFYYGLASGSYTVEEYVDNPGLSSHVIENLTPGTYYFALKAVNANGIESALSNEVSKVITGN